MLKIVSVILTFSGACGIEDRDSLIITGGSWINSKGETVATKTVDRYNSKVHTFFKFMYDRQLDKILTFLSELYLHKENNNYQGFVEDLPEMNVARRSHGCGYLYQDGKKVNILEEDFYHYVFEQFVVTH